MEVLRRCTGVFWSAVYFVLRRYKKLMELHDNDTAALPTLAALGELLQQHGEYNEAAEIYSRMTAVLPRGV